ncbi:MAG: hypothetical protein L6254_01725 [Candidatus Omnitrophica bacterium]|nr:hypothetical protein [Candidatus Omnitrophota bacterium]
MDKKHIYEHLAEIYLDASSKRKKKVNDPSVFKNPLFISITVFFISGFILFAIINSDRIIITKPGKGKTVNLKSEVALILQPDAVKMNFHFDPAQKEIYAINLNDLNLVKYEALGFSVRKAKYGDNIILKIEFLNASNEKSEVYLANIPSYKWRDYRINLKEFRDINDWSKMLNLSFIVEEWNIEGKRGIVYIDNIRFLR